MGNGLSSITQQQQQQQRSLPPPPARTAAASDDAAASVPWTCAVCTYQHEGLESNFLSCAMCGTPRIGA
jgi:rubrerythrin